MILFRNDGIDQHASFMQTYKFAAMELKGKVLFAYSDIAIGVQEHLAKFLDVKESDLPTLRAIIPDGMKKYKCEVHPSKMTK